MIEQKSHIVRKCTHAYVRKKRNAPSCGLLVDKIHLLLRLHKQTESITSIKSMANSGNGKFFGKPVV